MELSTNFEVDVHEYGHNLMCSVLHETFVVVWVFMVGRVGYCFGYHEILTCELFSSVITTAVFSTGCGVSRGKVACVRERRNSADECP